MAPSGLGFGRPLSPHNSDTISYAVSRVSFSVSCSGAAGAAAAADGLAAGGCRLQQT